MADLGGVECAAGKWLQRLSCGDRLPPKVTLEVLRRRETSARAQAEALADAERRCAWLAQQRLEDERGLGARRAEALLEARADLEAERQRRAAAEAEVASAREELRDVERRLAEETARHDATRRGQRAASRKVEELKAIVADDHSLRVIDDFREKFQRQRAEAAALRSRIAALEEGASASEALVRRSRQDLAAARRLWGYEREDLVRGRDSARSEVSRLRRAGEELQRAADAALVACEAAAADAAARADAAAEEQRSSGAGVLAALQPLLLADAKEEEERSSDPMAAAAAVAEAAVAAAGVAACASWDSSRGPATMSTESFNEASQAPLAAPPGPSEELPGVSSDDMLAAEIELAMWQASLSGSTAWAEELRAAAAPDGPAASSPSDGAGSADTSCRAQLQAAAQDILSSLQPLLLLQQQQRAAQSELEQMLPGGELWRSIPEFPPAGFAPPADPALLHQSWPSCLHAHMLQQSAQQLVPGAQH